MWIILQLLGHDCSVRNGVSFPPMMGLILQLMGHVCLMRNIYFFFTNYGTHFTADGSCLLDENHSVFSPIMGLNFYGSCMLDDKHSYLSTYDWNHFTAYMGHIFFYEKQCLFHQLCGSFYNL